MNWCLAGLIGVATLVSPRAENWPHWRGPSLNSISPEKDLPLRWTRSENISWKLSLPGRSGSTPIVWGDQIFLHVAEGEDLFLWAVERNRGEILWQHHLDRGNVTLRKHNMSSPSPVTDGDRVWVITGTGALKCIDFEGSEVWVRNLQKEYGPFGLNWGYGSSPMLFESTLVLQVLHGMKTDQPSYIVAIDKNTGTNLWRVERQTDAVHESPDSYSTPALLRYDGKVEIVVTGGDYVTGHSLKTGKELWRGGGLNPEKKAWNRIVASPTVVGRMIYVPTRVQPFQAFKAGSQGDITFSSRVWAKSYGPDVPTPVVDGGRLYLVNDKGIMWCLDAITGEEIWAKQRLRPGTYSSSPVTGDGKIYITSEDGVTTVVSASPEFKILAENILDEYTLATPAISDGQIFLRTDEHLYCIGQRLVSGEAY